MIKLEEFDKAIYDFSTAIQLNPNCTILYKNRALAYKLLGQEEKSKIDFDKSMALLTAPNNTFSLSLILWP